MYIDIWPWIFLVLNRPVPYYCFPHHVCYNCRRLIFIIVCYFFLFYIFLHSIVQAFNDLQIRGRITITQHVHTYMVTYSITYEKFLTSLRVWYHYNNNMNRRSAAAAQQFQSDDPTTGSTGRKTNFLKTWQLG